jgi:putative Ig domain-containing protein
MADKRSVPTCGSRLLPVALAATLAALALAFAGDAGAERPKLISQPSIGANPVVGQPLGVNMGSFFCSPECFEFTVEFMRCAPGSNTVGCVSVRGPSANAFYTPTEDDIGFSLSAVVRAWNYDCDITLTDCRNSALEVPTAATTPVKEDAPAVPVRIATSELRDAEAGIPYSHALSVSSGRPPITWTLAGGSLPAGLSLSANGLISGSPRLAGEYTFTVRATGARRQTDTKQLTLKVKLQLSPRSGTVLRAAVGTAFRQAFNVVAGGTPPYTWGLAGGVLPEGLTFRDGVISGTPSRASRSTFMLETRDGRGASASTTWTLEVTWTALTITPASHFRATVGVPYRQVLTGSGGKPPYRFQLVSDCALPQGLRLLPAGVLAGTPTAAPGFYRFEVIMQDANGTPGPPANPKTGTEPYIQQYSLRLQAGRRSKASGLPWAALGKPYRWEFGVCGGRLSFAFTISSGKLPPGMRLVERTGLLTGKPMQPGTFRFTIRTSECTAGGSYAVICPPSASPAEIVSERSYSLTVRSARRS